MQITSKKLSYTYSAKTKFAVDAIKDITLTIDEGEFFGIIGRTGSGKSTLIQHFNGLIKIGKKDGELTIGEFNLSDKKCNFRKLRASVGMVFQYPEYQLFAETVFDDVAFGVKNFETLSKEDLEIKVRTAIEIVGLNFEEVKDKSPFDLSGGQKRRVAIAGVIVTRPSILVLDEPVAGLDPKGKREFFALLHSLHNSFVKTIIIVSHDMDNVAEHCTRVAVLEKGELLKVARPSELFSDSALMDIGLGEPQTAYLTRKLREKGIDIKSDLTIDDFIYGVTKYAKKEETL